jgi:hypothetical protein
MGVPGRRSLGRARAGQAQSGGVCLGGAYRSAAARPCRLSRNLWVAARASRPSDIAVSGCRARRGSDCVSGGGSGDASTAPCAVASVPSAPAGPPIEPVGSGANAGVKAGVTVAPGVPVPSVTGGSSAVASAVTVPAIVPGRVSDCCVSAGITPSPGLGTPASAGRAVARGCGATGTCVLGSEGATAATRFASAAACICPPGVCEPGIGAAPGRVDASVATGRSATDPAGAETCTGATRNALAQPDGTIAAASAENGRSVRCPPAAVAAGGCARLPGPSVWFAGAGCCGAGGAGVRPGKSRFRSGAACPLASGGGVATRTRP